MKGLKDIFKNAPKSLKSLGGHITMLSTVFITLIDVSRKLVQAQLKNIRELRSFSTNGLSNNQNNELDNVLLEGNKGLDKLKAGLDSFVDAIKIVSSTLFIFSNGLNGFNVIIENVVKSVDSISSMFVGLAEKSGNETLINIADATKKVSKVLTSTFDDGYGTIEQAEIVRELTKQGRLAGGSNKDANTLANKSFDMMSQLSKMGYDPELSKEAIVKAIYNRDYSGLAELGLNINENNMTSALAEAGVDTTGKTIYSDFAMSGLVESALEKMLTYDDKQLQEMTRQGLILKNINQNFAWEEVESLASVNADSGHYNDSGEFVVEGLGDVESELEDIEKNTSKVSNTGIQISSSSLNGLINSMNGIVGTSKGAISKEEMPMSSKGAVSDIDFSKLLDTKTVKLEKVVEMADKLNKARSFATGGVFGLASYEMGKDLGNEVVEAIKGMGNLLEKSKEQEVKVTIESSSDFIAKVSNKAKEAVYNAVNYGMNRTNSGR